MRSKLEAWWKILQKDTFLSAQQIHSWKGGKENRCLHISSIAEKEKDKQLSAQLLSLNIESIATFSEFSQRWKPEREWYQNIPYTLSKKHLFLPFMKDGRGKVCVLTSQPFSLQPLQILQWELEEEIVLVYAKKELLLDAIDFCYNQRESDHSQVISSLEKQLQKNAVHSVQKREQERNNLLESQKYHGKKSSEEEEDSIIYLLNMILKEAIQHRASDVHIKSTSNGLNIRYRIDGILQDFHSLVMENQQQVITRIKVMAQLDIAEYRLPQDGRAHLYMGERVIDMRISTIPINEGTYLSERIVIRILDHKNGLFALSDLGMVGKEKEHFLQWIHRSEGFILITGPTGSGKSTTLYSSLAEIHADKKNIMTIEDPIEYHIEGISQMNIRPQIDLTFSKGLRHILRQDPDVILVGEIRDQETATIAAQASMTGHLVLSTLHTNDAPSAVTRLLDIGVAPYMLASSLLGVIAQRLVRVLCVKCREEFFLTEKQIVQWKIPSDWVEGSRSFFRPKGCDHCQYSGYRGRRAIYELMHCSAEVKNQIMRQLPSIKIRKQALSEGMCSLKKSGVALALQGITSLEEVNRLSLDCDFVCAGIVNHL